MSQKTYIMGPNGSGKTHILEGIHLLGNGKLIYNESQLEDRDFFLGKWRTEAGEKTFSLYRDDTSDRLTIQGEKVTKQKFRIALPFKTVFVSPFDMNLLYFAPSSRRDYLDSILERAYDQFPRLRRDYEQTMRQRNALLKNIREGGAKREDLDFWDAKFATLTETYTLYRKKYVEFISKSEKIITDYLPQYTHEFTYISSLNDMSDIVEGVKEYLKVNRERDILTGHTHIGPHRDDFVITINKGKNIPIEAQKYLSRGEVKLLLLSLKLIEVSFLETHDESAIILLIDDIFAELDEENIRRFLKSLKTYQTILTSQKSLPNGENWSEFTCINLKDT
ncbi:DNA replication/repair protein RecF [Candidatus Gracilibacteria bacterium]|nr:DNA replication/repair protein RecF [Candidatus Gracilibacteria bacterium]